MIRCDGAAKGTQVQQTITTRELVDHLFDVLDRVRDGRERFIIERHGEPVATLAPVGPRPSVMLYEALDALGDVELPGEGFADDLEAVQAAQPPARFPAWPT